MKNTIGIIVCSLVFVFLLMGAMGWFPESRTCDFKIPEGYKLVTFNDGKYGILQGGGVINEFLTCSGARYGRHWASIDDLGGFVSVIKFSDSCRAKGNLKAYLDNQNLNKFK